MMKKSLKETFLTPPDEFTPIPFWFWNNRLDEAAITAQIEDFHDKGVCGFVIHPRMGIPSDIPYLSDRFMHYVKHAVEEAKRLNMLVVLYDEGMYPSGSAHGMVVAHNPEYATRALRMEEHPLFIHEVGNGIASEDLLALPELAAGESLLSLQAVHKSPSGQITETFLLYSREKGINRDLSPRTIPSNGDQFSLCYFIETYSRGTIRGIHPGEDDKQIHAPASADLLNPDAMKEFIHLTHDRYYEVLGEYFGSTVIAMFTDEPDVLGRNHLIGRLPWTKGFLGWWESCGGSEQELPFLWSDDEDVRRRFHKAVNRRLGQTYYRQLSEWCAAHGIALTGHPAQSTEIGFLKYFQIPGQDLVWRWVAPENGLALTGPNSTMAKCSSDAARHAGRRRNSNECFGCCGPAGDQWAFSADDMKWYLDWMFVRGVNLLYPHAYFYSLEGKIRSGERPPDVGPHNIWWRDYRLFTDYIKRMCWLMTDSVNTTQLAVLCEEDDLPWRTAGELFRNQIEFNYLEKSLLAQEVRCENGSLRIAAQAYRILLVEAPSMLTGEICGILSDFTAEGGILLILADEGTPLPLAGPNVRRVSSLTDLVPAIDALRPDAPLCGRELMLSPACADLRVSHIIKEGRSMFVLVNEGEAAYQGRVLLPLTGIAPASPNAEQASRPISASVSAPALSAELWHPWQGSSEPASCEPASCGPCGELCSELCAIPVRLERRESLILALGSPASGSPKTTPADSFLRVPLQVKWRLGKASLSQTVIDAGFAEADCPIPLPGPEIDGLADWTSWPGMEHFSGTIQYEARFDLSAALSRPREQPEEPPSATSRRPSAPASSRRILLDLGEVHEIARLAVNGRFVGVRMWAPYRFDITEYLTDGTNLLQLEIVNALANGMSRSGLPSGLLGPVALLLPKDA